MTGKNSDTCRDPVLAEFLDALRRYGLSPETTSTPVARTGVGVERGGEGVVAVTDFSVDDLRQAVSLADLDAEKMWPDSSPPKRGLNLLAVHVMEQVETRVRPGGWRRVRVSFPEGRLAIEHDDGMPG